MRVVALQLERFRNYAALDIEPPGGACVLIGANAQGKSNLLEALSLLATGKSFRATREVDMIALGAPAASVRARVRTRTGETSVACILTRVGEGARKRFMRNGRSVTHADFLGGLAAVTFVPADLQLVAGAASIRRRLLNAALAQLGRAYYHDLATYAKIVTQKNALLRASGAPDRVLLATYDEALTDAGTRLTCARAAYVRRLGAAAARAHARWLGPHPELRLIYLPSPPMRSESPADVAAAFGDALGRMRNAEIARKVSLVGPHRDDVAIQLGDAPLARYGSQGQQRTAVLAIKAAEYELLAAATGEPPLLLLDDVLSELDADRRRAFLGTLAGAEQAFITATDAPDSVTGSAASIMFVRAGAVETSAERDSA